MPCGRISTRPVAFRFPRTLPPTTMLDALMSASTSARSPTITRPFTFTMPSKRPASSRSPSPTISPLMESFSPTLNAP